MRTKKRKVSLGIKIASILACVAMLSVGFAAWMIVNIEQPKDIQSGQFVAHTVETRTVKFETAEFVAGTEISFSAPTTLTGVTNKWLQPGDGENKENLSTSFKFKVADEDGKSLKDVLTTVTVELKLPSKIQAAISAGYITSPTLKCGDQQATDTDHDGTILMSFDCTNVSEGSLEKTLTVEFQWGTAFGGVNPYIHYNNQTVSDQLAEEANTKLTALYGVNTEKMDLTLTAVGK